jgi:polar amino acid transport system ATP-binding protein
MIMVTHDLQLAASISDHVVFLHNGLIEEEGPPDAIFGMPKSQRLQQFITAVGPA